MITPPPATRVAALFLAVAVTLPSVAGPPTWIGVEGNSRPNRWLAFRKVVDLEAERTEPLRVAADTKYWLWIDGEIVVREGGLKRGPTPDDSYVDVVDVDDRLPAGSHTLAVLVWHFGKPGFSHNDSGRAGLLIDAGDSPLSTDDTWRAIEHPAFADTEDPKPNFRLPESNIRFDAAADLPGWTDADFDTDRWSPAKTLGQPGGPPWGALVERPIPLWRWSDVRRYENDLTFPIEGDGEPIEAVLPANLHVTPTMTVKASGGEVIDIRTDHYRGGGPPSVRAEYVCREGEQTFECRGWMNGHKVLYDVPEGVEVLDLGYRESGYDADFTGTFTCDDEFLNRFRDKAVRTLYVTMRDTYMDCPDRERAQWWGDAVLELGEAFYALDRRSDRLARKGIDELLGWQRDDGTIFSPVPAGNYSDELPMQMLASVGRYGIYAYALHSGDVETVRRHYDAIGDYLDVWQTDDDGLVVPRKGGWTWGDWGNNKDMPLLFNGWYALALDGRIRMARMIGRDGDVRGLKTKLNRLRDAFNDRFWTGSQYRSPGYQGVTDDRGHALAVLAGIADESRRGAVVEVLKRQRHSSPYMEKYVLEALMRMGHIDIALGRMKDRYRKMVDSELTTLWEGWGIGSEGFGGGTTNHAWSGGPLTLMSEFIAGIRPTSPGYRSVTIRPDPGPLRSFEAHVDSVAGAIDVSLSGGKLSVSLPDGVEALVVTPGGGRRVGGGDHAFDWSPRP